MNVFHDEPTATAPLGHLVGSAYQGLDHAEIRLRYDGRHGTRRVLLLLARLSIEVLVAAREAKGLEGREIVLHTYGTPEPIEAIDAFLAGGDRG